MSFEPTTRSTTGLKASKTMQAVDALTIDALAQTQRG